MTKFPQRKFTKNEGLTQKIYLLPNQNLHLKFSSNGKISYLNCILMKSTLEIEDQENIEHELHGKGWLPKFVITTFNIKLEGETSKLNIKETSEEAK